MFFLLCVSVLPFAKELSWASSGEAQLFCLLAFRYFVCFSRQMSFFLGCGVLIFFVHLLENSLRSVSCVLFPSFLSKFRFILFGVVGWF